MGASGSKRKAEKKEKASSKSSKSKPDEIVVTPDDVSKASNSEPKSPKEEVKSIEPEVVKAAKAEKKSKKEEVKPPKSAKEEKKSLKEEISSDTASSSEVISKKIDVPKKRHGIIIGPQGSTIKDIRKQTNAEVVLPDSNGESTEVVVRGTADAVDKAIKYIQKLMKEKDDEHQKTVDGHEKVSQDTEKIYAKYQADIDAAAKKRTELHEGANTEYEAGNKDKAAKMRAEAKEQTAIMEKLQEKAGTEIFESLNKKYSDGLTIDLHGLHVETALKFLKERIAKLKKEGKSELTLIYGAGNHSKKDVGARIKPECQKFLKEEGLSYTEINNGSVKVSL